MLHLEKRQLRQLSLICAAVALAVVVITLFIVFLTSGGEEDAPPPASSGAEGPVIPEGMRLFQDLYEGEVIIPDFDVPDNKLDMEGFTADAEGRLAYEGAVLGVDVSEFQGEVDWYAVKAAGIEFAILRTGYRGMTQGLLKEDQCFRQNLEGAANAGLKLGVYFFSQAVTTQEAEAEAAYVINALEGYEISYPVAFDWEPIAPGSGARTDGLDNQVLTRCAAAFCEKIKEAGLSPAVYFNQSLGYLRYDLRELADYDLWLAEYDSKPDFYYHFDLWQYTHIGRVAGIEGDVDLDLDLR